MGRSRFNRWGWPFRAAPVLVRAGRSRLAGHKWSVRVRLGANGRWCRVGRERPFGVAPAPARVARLCRAAREWLSCSSPARVARWCRVGHEWPFRALRLRREWPVGVALGASGPLVLLQSWCERSVRASPGTSGPFVPDSARVARWCRRGASGPFVPPPAANETPARRLSTASGPTGASAASPIRGPRRRRGGLRDRASFPWNHKNAVIQGKCTNGAHPVAPARVNDQSRAC